MLATILCVCAAVGQPQANEMPWVQVAKGKKSFVLQPSGKPFTPWGFNYDHDSRLICADLEVGFTDMHCNVVGGVFAWNNANITFGAMRFAN